MAADAAWMFIHGQRLRRKMKEAGAISEETAKTIEELKLSKREIRTLKRNVWNRRVKEVKDKKGEKRYYVPSDK